MADPAAGVAVFVYFKANTADDTAVRSSLIRHRQQLSIHGVQLRFWRRTDERHAGQTTWMESYENAPYPLQALTQLISESASTAGLDGLSTGPRHIETFELIDPVEL